MEMWKDNPEQWIRSAEIRKKLVLGFNEDYIYNDNLKQWLNKETGIKYDKKLLLYSADGHLYRDLKELVNKGILDKDKVTAGKGVDESYYRPSRAYRLEPIKLYYASLIEKKDINHIYHGLEYLLLLPENLPERKFLGKTDTTKNQEEIDDVARIILLEKIVKKCLNSVRLLLLDARLEKAKMVWQKKINDGDDLYAPLKLHLWTEQWVSLIIERSPLIFQAIAVDMVTELNMKIKQAKKSLQNMIFWDICQSLGYSPKDMKEMNERMRDSLKNNHEYIERVVIKVHKILEEKEFGLMIAPTAFLMSPPEKMNAEERDIGEKFFDAFESLLNEREEQGLVKMQKSGEKILIQKTKELDLMEMYPYLIDFPPGKIDELGIGEGKGWFSRFSKDTRKELKKLCSYLGYTKNEMYRALGLFVFPLPFIPHK
ncbi:MAG: hypothetical protein IMZ53_09030 [Thermoplasmata archaeon]|nr:hypothetical protein [Thermoplasmata archaeon]